MVQQLGGRCAVLVSLTFAHYITRAGTSTVVGAETAQALINTQLFYAIIRGAATQYGLLWFGNVSVYNRFGYKSYPAALAPPPPPPSPSQRPQQTTHKRRQRRRLAGKTTPSSTSSTSSTSSSSSKGGSKFTCSGQGGPTCGTSLSLMRRLMLAQVFQNAAYVSFENAWFYANNTVSPVGAIQQAVRNFTATTSALLSAYTTTLSCPLILTPLPQLIAVSSCHLWPSSYPLMPAGRCLDSCTVAPCTASGGTCPMHLVTTWLMDCCGWCIPATKTLATSTMRQASSLPLLSVRRAGDGVGSMAR